MKNKKIVELLAEGFEEIEAVTPVDVLRRLGCNLITAGLSSKSVSGAHGIRIQTDCLLDEIKPDEIGGVILPGGMPGSKNLKENDKVIELVRHVYTNAGIVAAICAAPIVLGRADIVKGKRVTVYPGFENELTGAIYTAARVERDSNIITGKGPGVAYDFAIEIGKALCDTASVNSLIKGMFIPAV